MTDLIVEVRDRDITVKTPSGSQSVTYRHEQGSGMLVALDEMRELDADRLAFLARAWRAAHHEAKRLGWLESGLDVAGAAKP